MADAFAGHLLTGHGWGSRALGHWAEWSSSFVNATPALAFVAAIFLLARTGTCCRRGGGPRSGWWASPWS